jgi:hypothetical protein
VALTDVRAARFGFAAFLRFDFAINAPFAD